MEPGEPGKPGAPAGPTGPYRHENMNCQLSLSQTFGAVRPRKITFKLSVSQPSQPLSGVVAVKMTLTGGPAGPGKPSFPRAP